MAEFVVLKRGDKDKLTKWGGKQLTAAPAYTVSDLQKDLKAVGTFDVKVNGVFGPRTELAVKLYQWARKNSDESILNKAIATVTKATLTVSGQMDKATYDDLKKWVKEKKTVTGNLVKVDVSKLSNIELGSVFEKIGGARVGKNDLIISKNATDLLKDMNAEAKKLKLTISLNQVFRIYGVKVSGAVVTPAAKSQHLIGHAIDCNIIDGKSWNTSANFKAGKETENAKKFIAAIEKKDYRWGGKFPKKDTPHFDDQLEANTFDYDANFYLNQRQFNNGDPISKKTP